MDEFKSAKDFITSDNVISTWTEGKHICFKIKDFSGAVIKLNPNESPAKGVK